MVRNRKYTNTNMTHSSNIIRNRKNKKKRRKEEKKKKEKGKERWSYSNSKVSNMARSAPFKASPGARSVILKQPKANLEGFLTMWGLEYLFATLNLHNFNIKTN